MEVKQMENKNAVELFQMKVAHVGMNAAVSYTHLTLPTNSRV